MYLPARLAGFSINSFTLSSEFVCSAKPVCLRSLISLGFLKKMRICYLFISTVNDLLFPHDTPTALTGPGNQSPGVSYTRFLTKNSELDSSQSDLI